MLFAKAVAVWKEVEKAFSETIVWKYIDKHIAKYFYVSKFTMPYSDG